MYGCVCGEGTRGGRVALVWTHHAAVVIVGATAVVVGGTCYKVVGICVVAAAVLTHRRERVGDVGQVVVRGRITAAKDLVRAGPPRIVGVGGQVSWAAKNVVWGWHEGATGCASGLHAHARALAGVSTAAL